MKNETPTTPPAISFSPKTIKKQNFSMFPKRAKLQQFGKRNNDGTFKHTGGSFIMKPIFGSPIYIPQRKKLKGYQKEARRRA